MNKTDNIPNAPKFDSIIFADDLITDNASYSDDPTIGINSATSFIFLLKTLSNEVPTIFWIEKTMDTTIANIIKNHLDKQSKILNNFSSLIFWDKEEAIHNPAIVLLIGNNRFWTKSIIIWSQYKTVELNETAAIGDPDATAKLIKTGIKHKINFDASLREKARFLITIIIG